MKVRLTFLEPVLGIVMVGDGDLGGGLGGTVAVVVKELVCDSRFPLLS